MPRADSAAVAARDTSKKDTAQRKSFLDDVISGKNQDSLVYDLRNKTVYIYEKGDVDYQDKNLKADFMKINMDDKIIFAYGREDTTTKTNTRPEFTDGGSTYQMDTITYNIATEKARIKGVNEQRTAKAYLKRLAASRKCPTTRSTSPTASTPPATWITCTSTWR